MTKLPFRIFHIDDNRLDRELIRDALEQENNQFVLTVATSRQEFEAGLLSGNFDLVLTDFNILGFDGLQVIDAVREIDPMLPVIVVTGTGSEEIAVEAMKRGAFDYVIKKPHHIRRLPLTIQAAIERKMLLEQRAQSEKALRESEGYLRAVVSSTPVILFVLNKDGILTLLQGHGLTIFSTEPQTFIGESIFDTMSDFIPDIQERFQLAMMGTETASIQSIGDIILDVRYSPMREKAGEVCGIIGVATDITERLKAERLELELEKEQEVIALKERFISIASHDFRTPLTIIKISAKMLEIHNDQITSEQRIAKLRQINTQVDHMVQLLNDVLTMSKANAGMLDFSPERVELKSYCEEIWDNFRQIAEKTHRMEFDYNCDKDMISIDPNLVHYIIANLLSNAAKYSPVNGQVRFEIKCNDTHLILRVTDNGIGIPQLDQAQLFQPFHRATNVQGIDGTGLGLSIVKSYVEVHEGRIEVESDEGQGTTFTVFIPVDVDPQTK